MFEVKLIFLLIDATDRSKISSDQKRFFIALSLYPLSYFANTPFNKPFGENWVKFKIQNLPILLIFDVFTVWIGRNLIISFISKLSLVYTQANIQGQVAKIQPCVNPKQLCEGLKGLSTYFYVTPNLKRYNWMDYKYFIGLKMGKISRFLLYGKNVNSLNFMYL